jgi:hypothetical protein
MRAADRTFGSDHITPRLTRGGLTLPTPTLSSTALIPKHRGGRLVRVAAAHHDSGLTRVECADQFASLSSGLLRVRTKLKIAKAKKTRNRIRPKSAAPTRTLLPNWNTFGIRG